MVNGSQAARPAHWPWLGLALGGLGLFALAATGSQLQTVADRAWTLWPDRLVLPAGFVMWVLPVLLTVASGLAARFAGGAVSWPRAIACTSVVLGLIALWLACLVRHDRPLTALHAGCLTLALMLGVQGLRRRVLAAAIALPVLALVSYGAVWGETRCQEPEGMKCLVEHGPRIWVPALLQRLGVAVFVDLRAADLRAVDWRNRDLRLADLRGARLSGATLAGSNLRRSRLDGIQADDSDWQGVFMNGSSMTGSTLLRANLSEVQAYLVDLRGTDLSRSDLRRASLSHTRLDGVALDSAQLQGAYLRFSTGLGRHQLQQASFDDTTRWPDGQSP